MTKKDEQTLKDIRNIVKRKNNNNTLVLTNIVKENKKRKNDLLENISNTLKELKEKASK
ncbi:MAG: hypothetical protein HRK26_00685 [Rickettsiaceae bacterium H1]|nr:hypothetical protein [Rickettsiaceae bacterium H1]